MSVSLSLEERAMESGNSRERGGEEEEKERDKVGWWVRVGEDGREYGVQKREKKEKQISHLYSSQ